jgi:hypothetical protein
MALRWPAAVITTLQASLDLVRGRLRVPNRSGPAGRLIRTAGVPDHGPRGYLMTGPAAIMAWAWASPVGGL